MLRMVYLMHRAQSLSRASFQAYLRDDYARTLVFRAKDLGIARCLQSYTMDDPLNEELQKTRGTLEPYDGVGEFWWDSKDTLAQALTSNEGMKALREICESGLSFLDSTRSSLWLAFDIPQINPLPENVVARKESPTIKLIYPLRRLTSLPKDEAQLYWRMQHGPIVRRYGLALGVLRYIQVHRFEDPLEEGLRKIFGVEEEPFDGHAELWWDRTSLLAALNTQEGQEAFQALIEDESRFIDFSRSCLWFSKEWVLFER